MSPYEMIIGKAPDFSNLKAFGCICYVDLPKTMGRNLDPKAKKCLCGI